VLRCAVAVLCESPLPAPRDRVPARARASRSLSHPCHVMAGEDARVGAAMEAAVDAVTELVRLSEGFGRALEQHVTTVAAKAAPGASGRLPGPPGAAVPKAKAKAKTKPRATPKPRVEPTLTPEFLEKIINSVAHMKRIMQRHNVPDALRITMIAVVILIPRNLVPTAAMAFATDLCSTVPSSEESFAWLWGQLELVNDMGGLDPYKHFMVASSLVRCFFEKQEIEVPDNLDTTEGFQVLFRNITERFFRWRHGRRPRGEVDVVLMAQEEYVFTEGRTNLLRARMGSNEDEDEGDDEGEDEDAEEEAAAPRAGEPDAEPTTTADMERERQMREMMVRFDPEMTDQEKWDLAAALTMENPFIDDLITTINELDQMD
jgi:hypothetical protein